jgi:hypothetical protein
LKWDKQLNLTNFDHYEIQVSADQASWYSLKFDGTDWKDTLGAVTSWTAEILIHTMIPNGGTADVPTAVTLYYRVRRVTKVPTPGDWSTTASATTAVIGTGDITGTAINTAKLATGAVTEIKVADGAITTGKLTAKSVTSDKLSVGVLLDNIVLNPGAEDGIVAWGLVEGTGTITVSSVDKTEGTNSFLLSAPIVAFGCRAIPVNPGDTYTYRVKLRGVTGTASGLYLRSNEKTTYPAGDFITVTNRTSFTDFVSGGPVPVSWTLYEGMYTVPAGIYWISFSIYNYTGGPAGGIYFDEVEVRKQLESVHIKDGIIIADKLAANSVIADKILAGAVVAGKIGALAVDTAQLAALAVTAAKIAANTITANEIVAAFLSGAFAKFTGELVVGQDYTGSPPAGAQRIVIDGNELRLDEYNGSAWEVIFRIGGDDMLKWYLQARGLIKTGADVSGIPIGEKAPGGSKLFDLEGDLKDQNENLPFTDGGVSFVPGIFGLYGISGNNKQITDEDANGLDFGGDFCIDGRVKPTALSPASDELLLWLRNNLGDPVSAAGVNMTAGAGIVQYPEVVKLTSTLFATSYTEASSNKYVRAGQIDPTNGNIVLGTPVTYGTSIYGNYTAIVRIDDTRFALCWANSSDYDGYVRIGEVNPTDRSITFGTVQVFHLEAATFGVPTVVWTGSYLCCGFYKGIGSSDMHYNVCTVSGTTITLGSDNTVAGEAYNGTVSRRPLWLPISSTTFAAVFSKSGVGVIGKVCTISGTTISFGAASSGIATSFLYDAQMLSSSMILLCYLATSNLYCVVMSISGTTVTLQTAYSYGASLNYAALAILDESRFMLAFLTDTTWIGRVAIGSVSGSYVIIYSTNSTDLFDATSGNTPGSAVAMDSCRAVVIWGGYTAEGYGKAFGIIANDIWVDLYLSSTNLKWRIRLPAANVDLSYNFAITVAAHHISMQFDFSEKDLWVTVDNTSQYIDLTGYTLLSGETYRLGLRSPVTGYSVVWDDLLLLDGNFLTAAQSIAHYSKVQPWVDSDAGIDYLLDLILLARSGGKIKLLSPTDYYAPVSGEPSIGTPHEHHKVIYNSASLAANDNPTIDLSADVPTGVKVVFVWYWCYFGAGGNTWLKNTAGTVKYAKARQNGSVHAGAQAFVTLDASRTFKFVNEVAVSELDMEMTYYWL